MTPSHLLKAFLNLLYLGSVDLDLQSLPGFLNLIQLLNVEANIETPPAELNVQTSLTEKPLGENESLMEKPLANGNKTVAVTALVAEHFAKVGLEIPKGIVFKEESAENRLLCNDFPDKVGFKEESLVVNEVKDSNINKKKFASKRRELKKERSSAKFQLGCIPVRLAPLG